MYAALGFGRGSIGWTLFSIILSRLAPAPVLERR